MTRCAYSWRALGESMLRSSFLHALLDALQRQTGGKARDQLLAQLPSNLRSLLHSSVLSTAGSDVLITLDDADDFLLAVEQALGDGSGALLQGVGQEIAARVCSSEDGPALTSVADVVRHLGSVLVRAVVGAKVRFEVMGTITGFALTVGVEGRSTTTAILRHLSFGLIQAAHAFALEPTQGSLKLSAQLVGDRCEITARYRTAGSSYDDPTPPPSSRERVRRSSRPSVALEVERILSGSRPPRAGEHELTPAIPSAPRVPQFERATKKG